MSRKQRMTDLFKYNLHTSRQRIRHGRIPRAYRNKSEPRFFLPFGAYNDAEFVSVAWRSRSVPARVCACAVEIGPSIRFLPTILSRETLLSRCSITIVLTHLPITIFAIDRRSSIERKIGNIVRPKYQPFLFVFRVIAEQVITAKIVVSS